MCTVSHRVRNHTEEAPPLKPVPVGEPFECLRVDFKRMNFKEMDASEDGNRYKLVFKTKARGICCQGQNCHYSA